MTLAQTSNEYYGVHMDTNYSTSAAAVKAAYTKADRAQKWTAEKAGISLSSFRRRINGGGDFTTKELARIAKALDVHPVELLPAEFAQVVAA